MGHHLKCTMHNNSTRTVHTAKLTIFCPNGGNFPGNAIRFISKTVVTTYCATRQRALSAMQYHFLSAVQYQILSAVQYQFLRASRHHF